MRILIAGLGSIGRRHARNLAALGISDLMAWRALGRPLPDDGEPLPPMPVFRNLHEALAEKPDAVLVCGPPSTHTAVALAAARAGAHLFIEKPLAHAVDGVHELRATAAAAGVVTLVGFNLRFHPGLRLVRSFVDSGRIGRVCAISAQVGQYLPDWHPHEDYRGGYSAQRALGGGVVLDLIHELDYVRWLGGDVREVSAFSARAGDLEIETEDVASILFRFESAIGTIQLDYLQRTPSRSCRVVGTAGTIEWDYHRQQVGLYTAGSGWETHTQDPFERNEMFAQEMRHFLACVRGEERPVVDLEEGIYLLRLALAAEESNRTGRVHRIEREVEAWPAYN